MPGFFSSIPESLSELKKLKHKFGGLPNDRDLTGAAKALIRLRSTYKIDLATFSQGNILGIDTSAHLTTKDSFFLGRYAYMNGHLQESQKWLELAALQAASEAKASNQTSISLDQLDQMLDHLQQEMQGNF